MNPKKILISGGWGYKNLGDDAILLATIQLVKDSIPTAEIVISSYDPIETEKLLFSENINVIPSVYKYIWGGRYIKKFFNGAIFKKKSLFRRVANAIDRHMSESVANLHLLGAYYFTPLYIALLRKFRKPLFEQFFNVDLFIMSGGGYFNSWKESLLSRFLEIEIATLCNAKVFVIAQSIGPFSKIFFRNIAKKCLVKCDLISVRDDDSFSELQQLNIFVERNVIPDLALYQQSVIKKKHRLVFIPFGDEIKPKEGEVVEVLNEFQKKFGFEIVVSVSQLWTTSVEHAQRIYEYCKELGCQVNLYIPSDVYDLQMLLGQSEIVISQNLHGLILAYRAGTSIVCLNDKRKFQTFMKMVNRSHLLQSVGTINFSLLKDAIIKSLEMHDDEKKRQDMSCQIKSEFLRYLGSNFDSPDA